MTGRMAAWDARKIWSCCAADAIGHTIRAQSEEKIRAELREYLQGMCPDWNEKELIYKKGME